ncbi:PSD1 and planctomycete cytochrome C domain-containing protein [Novipirellula sp. SH528]|uniref:PSD1 and planctomycete cytochrome C domain-containing protein n=1 Tax=Novipirellula sp. SH528 TaxID=3454466 RepID=UPI003FA0B74C
MRNLIVVGCILLMQPSLLADEIDFERDILPIFNESCVECHGPDEQESGFRVDSRVALLKGGDYGDPGIVPGDDRVGLLIKAVSYEDSDLEMPPEEKLSDEKIALLRRWVKEGAVWPGQMDAKVVREKSDHWSFQPVVRPEVPSGITLPDSNVASANTQESNRTAIDAFLLDRLAKDGLQYSEPADPRSLIRRVSIILTGLAPTPDEVDAFVMASQSDSEAAYTELVDRLLESPHFGERWAQHWLDVIRWAETNGSESNMYRKNAWIYRDYVVRAFNEDKPYDQFLFEQIAGDTVGVGDATGYLVSGPHVPLATVGREETARRQARADRMDEILQTVGATAMGMTIGCARCHNHKFDPISIKDYYSMSAVFQDIEFGSRFPELAEDHPRRIRGKELYAQINQVRRQLRTLGPWEEDWIGYQEIHFPAKTTPTIRVSFQSNFVRLDELEVLGTEQLHENLALDSSGTVVDYSKANTSEGSPIGNINDGLFGNDAWMVRGNKNSKEKPWVQFTFKEPQQVNRIRLSTNREDYLETDYLDNLNKQMYEIAKIEVQDEQGEWTEVFSAQQIKELNKKHSERDVINQKLQALIEQVNEEGPKPSFVARFIKPVKTHVFSRGSPENPGEEVYAAGMSELGGDLGITPNASGKKRRAEFANWVIDPTNPLTARVAANRFWHHVFGQGIVTTTADFGAAGAPPTHPELLDWLAAELVQPSEQADHAAPWSMKHMIRLMVMSDAFRQSSLPRDEGLAVDAGSNLLWRFPPKRVEAEVIRDSILQASGVLDTSIGGRSFRIHNVKKRYAQWEIEDNYGPETWRRMIYQERMRRVDDQMFTAFDFPDCGQVQAKRPVSTTPLQALNLLNSDFVIEQSKLVAQRALDESGGDMRLSVRRCFELLLTREPSLDELEACLDLAEQIDLSLVCRTLINTNEFAFLP